MSGKIFYISSLSDPTKEWVSYIYPFFTTKEGCRYNTRTRPNIEYAYLPNCLGSKKEDKKPLFSFILEALYVGRINETA